MTKRTLSYGRYLKHLTVFTCLLTLWSTSVFGQAYDLSNDFNYDGVSSERVFNRAQISRPQAPMVDPMNTSQSELTGVSTYGLTINLESPEGAMLGVAATHTDGRFTLNVTPKAAGTLLYAYAVNSDGTRSEATHVLVQQTELVLQPSVPLPLDTEPAPATVSDTTPTTAPEVVTTPTTAHTTKPSLEQAVITLVPEDFPHNDNQAVPDADASETLNLTTPSAITAEVQITP